MAQLAIVPAKSAMHPIKASPQLSSPFGTGAGKQNYLDFFISNFHFKEDIIGLAKSKTSHADKKMRSKRPKNCTHQG